MPANGRWDLTWRKPYPANVDNMGAPNTASKWQMGFKQAFKPYPANVGNMVSSK